MEICYRGGFRFSNGNKVSFDSRCGEREGSLFIPISEFLISGKNRSISKQQFISSWKYQILNQFILSAKIHNLS